MIQDDQDDIKNLRILQNNPDSKEVSFQRKLDTGDSSSDVNLQDIRQVFVFTQHENHLEFKKDLDMFELDHDLNQYTGRTIQDRVVTSVPFGFFVCGSGFSSVLIIFFSIFL